MPRRLCQCENKDHFDNIPGVHEFEEVDATKVVETPFGKFDVCNHCALHHLKSFDVGQETIDPFSQSEIPL